LAVENGKGIESFVEKGTMVDWNGNFTNYILIQEKTDVYTYSFVVKIVKFKIKTDIGVSFENSEYEFIDTK
jgi:hypothetical protein